MAIRASFLSPAMPWREGRKSRLLVRVLTSVLKPRAARALVGPEESMSVKYADLRGNETVSGWVECSNYPSLRGLLLLKERIPTGLTKKGEGGCWSGELGTLV